MDRSRLAGIGLIALGIGAVLSSLLGPLAFGVVDWRISGNMENQILGGDIVALALVAPVAIVAGALWWRGSRFGPVLALAPALYGVYTWPQYVIFPEYDRYDGNNEAAIPLYIAMTALSWALGAVSWASIPAEMTPEVGRGLRRGLAAAMFLLGGLFALTWSQQIATVIAGGSALAEADFRVEYEEHPNAFWLIKLLDLAFVIPLQIATGVGLLRNSALAIKAAFAVSGFLVLLTSAVSAMGIVMLVEDDPSASAVLPAVTTPLAVVLAVLTVMLYRAYISGTSKTAPHRADAAAPLDRPERASPS